MRKIVLAALVVVCALGLCVSESLATIYTTISANPSDMPVYGTMIGPSSYYITDYNGDPLQAGNALDAQRVFIADGHWQGGGAPFQMLKWDMHSAINVVRLYNSIDQGGGVAWEYMEWSVWGSTTGAENAGAWTLLWDPTAYTGTDYTNFEMIGTGTPPAVVYRKGTGVWPGDVGWGTSFTMDFQLPDSYRYIGIRSSTMVGHSGDYWLDPEIDAVATVIPEPSTLVIWSLLAGLGMTVGWWRRGKST